MEACADDSRPIKLCNVKEQHDCQNYRQCEKGNVEYALDLVYADIKSRGDFSHEQLVYLKRHIRVEKARHAKRRDDIANDEHHPTKPERIKRDAAKEPQKEVEHVAVKYSDCEGEKITPIEAAHRYAHNNKHKSLDYVFRHANGKPTPKRRDSLLHDECGRGYHRYTKVGLTAYSNAERYEDYPKEPEKLGSAFDFHINLHSAATVAAQNTGVNRYIMRLH